jgi:hypothetical protein
VSVDTIREDVVAAVKVAAGTSNVLGEDEFAPSASAGEAKKLDDRVPHWWVVSVDPIAHDEGLGWSEPRSRIRVVGTMAVEQTVAASGVSTRRRFRNVVAAVVAALTSPANRNPGSCLDTTRPAVGPVVVRSRAVGGKLVSCLEAAIEYEAQEE